MRRASIVLTLLAGFGLAATLPATAAESHDHHHHPEAAPAKLQLDKGRKWATDAALRESMAALRAEFAGRLHAIHTGSLSKDEYGALGRSIEGRVGAIVSQCKLEPKADAMLHIVIAELMAAADVLQGKAPGQPAGAAHRAVVALNDYGRHFAHPGWKVLR